MNKLFYGIVAVALIAMLAVPVHAMTIGNGIPDTDVPPMIYLLKSEYDICADDGHGGSRPYLPVDYATGSQDAEYDGCVVAYDNVRMAQYAFAGEQIRFKVLVRDLNGVSDITEAIMTVCGSDEVICQDVTGASWRHYITDNDGIPALYPAQEKFDPAYDKVYDCILTVEPNYYELSKINIDAYDSMGVPTSNGGIEQTWFFNPAIVLDIGTSDGSGSVEYQLPPGQNVVLPGQTIYSLNRLEIRNLAEGGVDLYAFIAADDLTDPNGAALCPVSNVLDVDKCDVTGYYGGMWYRCKVGTIEDDVWHCITNKNTREQCTLVSCLGAQPIVQREPDIDDGYFGSIIKNQGDWSVVDPAYIGPGADCEFKLRLPDTCIGHFTEGLIHILVRAI